MSARTWLVRALGATLAGAATATLVGEAWLRLAPPAPGEGAREESYAETHALHPRVGLFVLDEELGYRPALGGPEYAEHGALRNEYALAKPPGVRRVLFLGDSVTRRGKIIAGLRELAGEAGHEYWNAGVTGYAIGQELDYYRARLSTIAADHVVLTFHLNDFEETPVMFLEGERMVAVHAPREERGLSPWWWTHSALYRFLETRRWPRAGDKQRVLEDVDRSLAELAELVRARGARLTVLVLPWLRPRSEWPPSLPGKHARVLATLARLGIEHYAFLDELDAALAAGEPVMQVPRDPQHPSDAFGRRMAESLLARGFEL